MVSKAVPRHRWAARNWKIAGGGYGIHWPEIDEDISTEGLLRGAPAPRNSVKKSRPRIVKRPR